MSLGEAKMAALCALKNCGEQDGRFQTYGHLAGWVVDEFDYKDRLVSEFLNWCVWRKITKPTRFDRPDDGKRVSGYEIDFQQIERALEFLEAKAHA
jgi:hypothetical protein